MQEIGKRNIVLIVIDALRVKNLGCYGYPLHTSPNIDELAEEGMLFEDAYSCTNVTDPSFTSIFSGKYPSSHGMIHHGSRVKKEDISRINKVLLLTEILKSRGYTTLGVDWLGRWHKRGFDYYTGVESKTQRFLDKIVPAINAVPGLSFLSSNLEYRVPVYNRLLSFNFSTQDSANVQYPTANIQTAKAMELIKKYHKKKFFLFIHYWDTHFPYSQKAIPYAEKFYLKEPLPPKETLERIIKNTCYPRLKDVLKRILRNNQGIRFSLAHYDGSIAFIDQEIGRLLKTFNRYGISDETLVILTADHGESLLEHEIYFDHVGLYDSTIHVPLIIKDPALPKKRVKGLVQHVDLVPTILEILGVSETQSYDGVSLMPLILKGNEIRSVVFAEEISYMQRKKAVRTKEYKYITALSKENAICEYCRRIHKPLEELFNLEKDPEEMHNVINEDPESAEKFRNLLQKMMDQILSEQREVHPSERLHEYHWSKEEEEEVKRRLKALGYLD